MKQIVRLCLSASLAIAAWTQTKPAEFDVASIRPALPGQEQRKNGPRLHPVRTTPGTVFMIDVDLGIAIAWAWDVAPFQLAGQSLPGSTFDIVAKAAGPATDEEMRVMMQSLLASRFGLKMHREERELAGMALVVAKDGAKLKSAEDQAESTFEPVPNKKMIHFGHMSMTEFARLVSEPIRKPVFDLTGLKGSFDFTLDGTRQASATTRCT
jgi:uncharacterized protein (TIGR03435 family)